MKVLLINHFPLQGSGSGIYTMNIALELIKKGHEPHVLVMDNQADYSEYPFPVTTLLFDKTRNQNPDLPFNFPCFTTHPKSNHTFYMLSDSEIEKYISKLIEKTKFILENWQADIIHAQHLWLAPYAALQLKIPYVITAHGTDLMGFKKDKRYQKYVKTAADNAGKIITISRQVHEETKHLLKLPEEKLLLNPNGFDDAIFRVKEVDKKKICQEMEIPDFSKMVSFVGKFTNFKGIDVLIQAAKIVTNQISDVIFVLAGDGQLKEELQVLARKLSLSNVFFVGHQSQENVADLYNLADVSVVPSRIEPFGLVAIEALACGTPVVATNAGGLPDFINEEVGALVEMENSEALAKAIIKELHSNSKQTKGKYAAEYAKKNYSWEKNIRNVISIYDEIIK
jgi:glycosyltransferase involved in cell wall biosynthesis